MIGRAAEQAICPFGDAPVRFTALAQVVMVLRLEVPGGAALAVLLVAHHLDMLGQALAVVDLAEGTRGIAEGGMGCHVADELAADIDAAAIAQSVEIIRSGPEHHGVLGIRIIRLVCCGDPTYARLNSYLTS